MCPNPESREVDVEQMILRADKELFLCLGPFQTAGELSFICGVMQKPHNHIKIAPILYY